jgi:hypothetical protein
MGLGMKIIFVGVFNDSKSTNMPQAAGFERIGIKVVRYNYRERQSVLGPKQRDTELIQLCQRVRPAFIFFSKCEEIDLRVYVACSKVTTTLLWYMDPFLKRDRPKFIANMKACHIVCCSLRVPYEEFQRQHPRVHYIPEGFDPTVDYPVEGVEQLYDVAFIGKLRSEERQKYHMAIGFHVHTTAFGHNHAIAVAQNRINLNFTEGGTSDRTYKVLAARGFYLTQPWPRMEDDFKIGRDLDVFTSIETLREKIAYYLANPDARKKIAVAGCETVQKFDLINFARRVSTLVCSVKKGKA